MAKKTITYDFESLAEAFNHFLPYILKKMEGEGVFKYDKGGLKNDNTPFTEEPKIDWSEVNKYQVVFYNKKESFFSKAWRKIFTNRNGEEDEDGTYRIGLVKLITDMENNE